MRNEVPSADEAHAFKRVSVKTRRPDDVELALFAKHRDGTIQEQAAIRKVLIRMAEIAAEEAGDTRSTCTSLVAQVEAAPA